MLQLRQSKLKNRWPLLLESDIEGSLNSQLGSVLTDKLHNRILFAKDTITQGHPDRLMSTAPDPNSCFWFSIHLPQSHQRQVTQLPKSKISRSPSHGRSTYGRCHQPILARPRRTTRAPVEDQPGEALTLTPRC